MAASERPGAAARGTGQRETRPAARVSRTVRRAGWFVAAATAVLMGGGFSWTLARAAEAPPTSAPLPAAEQQLVTQSDAIAQRVSADQRRIEALQAQVAQLTGAQRAGGVPRGGAAPATHAFTGAS